MNAHPDLAREHMEKSISLLDQFNLLHINDSIPKIANYAMFLTEQQKSERGISELQKLSGIIKEYHSVDCLDYAKVQETLATIYLMTANLPQAKTHFKRAFKIYEKIWADEPEMIEAKYQEIQELYPQIGFWATCPPLYSTIRQINIRIFQSDIIIRDTLLIWFSFA